MTPRNGRLFIAALGGCVYCGCHAPTLLASTDWRSSAALRPEPRSDQNGDRDDGATPSAPGDLFDEATEETPSDLERGLLVCRVETIGGTRMDRMPDHVVDVSFGERRTRLTRLDQGTWDFSVGLVDLEIGSPLSVRVTSDHLDGRNVLVQGTRAFGEQPLRWTERTAGVRTSIRCRTAEERAVRRALRRRLARLGRDEARAKHDVAALVGWADPRVLESVAEGGSTHP